MGFFEKLKEGLTKTKNAIFKQVDNLFKSFVKVDEDMLEELEELLNQGFDGWKKPEMMAFVQASLDCGPEAYDKIAEALGSKTPEEVKEYAAVFWKRGP